MFSKKLTADNFTNLIAAGTFIRGLVEYCGVLKIDGKVEGDLIRQAIASDKNEFTINIGETGSVSSNEVYANDAIVAGKLLSKKIVVENIFRVHKTAVIKDAEIYYRSLEIEPGALLINCKMIHMDHKNVSTE